ncbi:C-type lectin mannose-binding isoform-like [Simochromis diagramma]|uniref:C-type lectin mannose-binding isoform-like n=1 Tax=Simochromis diagramma TaxID=43689 RepID=UPI001A7F09EA|nr:C-type lectin mannose-binding isoform-like [Simochromis diagramma]
MMGLEGKWFDKNCGANTSFVCYNVTQQNKKNYMYISIAKTWPSAREYCIKLSMDLAVIENSEENAEVNSLKPNSDEIWIGLYRVPWTWSDKSQSSFKNWQSSSPNDPQGNQHCVVENNLHKWDDDIYTMNYVFICHQVAKLRTTVKITFLTDVDLTDSAINVQILQQLGAKLTNQGLTDFKLQWKIQPKKQENEENRET